MLTAMLPLSLFCSVSFTSVEPSQTEWTDLKKTKQSSLKHWHHLGTKWKLFSPMAESILQHCNRGKKSPSEEITGAGEVASQVKALDSVLSTHMVEDRKTNSYKLSLDL